jgi:major membrane immunogen (membrane-anchored lipoprotein)
MKITVTFYFVILLSVFFSASSFSQVSEIKTKALQDTTVRYKDGIYEGKSRASYKYEPFWGSVRFSVKNGEFTDISFMIRDSSLHETFDERYEKHFEGNEEYIRQSRNDWKGVQTYPAKLLQKQNINKIDAITGATWSYNIFKASVNEALKNSK